MLRGEHVVLRPYEREDVKRQHALMVNLELVLPGYASWEPQPQAVAEKRFERRLEESGPAGGERGSFAIEVDGTFVGSLELHPWSVSRRNGSASFGMGILHPDYVGRGYGREALTLFLDWCFRVQNFRRIWLGCWANNERAIRLYRRLGFIEEARERQAQYVNGQFTDILT